MCNEEVYQLLSSLMLQKPMAQMGFLLEHWNTLLQAVPPTGGWGGNRGSLPRTPSVRGTLNDAELFQTRSGSLFSSQSRSISLYSRLIWSKPAFWLRAYAADANFKYCTLYLTWLATAQPLTRAPYVVLFDLKPLYEDGNWQVCMLSVYISFLATSDNLI